jgi:hypothetical protein
MLVDEGLTVSVDSFDPAEVAAAVRAGASLVLSVNSANSAAAADWGCEVVVVPDVPATMVTTMINWKSTPSTNSTTRTIDGY